MKKIRTASKPGYVMIMGLIFLVVLMVLTAALLSQTEFFLKFTSRNTLDEQALNLAEAGADVAIWNINLSPSTYTGEANTQMGPGTFTVSVTPKDSTTKTITATGYVPNFAAPKAKRSVRLDVFFDDSTPIPLNYAIQTGNAVQMGSGSTINGSVYSNGPINASSPANINGEAWSTTLISDPIVVSIPPKHSYAPAVSLPQPAPDYATAINTWKTQSSQSYQYCPTGCTINTGTTTIGNKKYIGDLTISGSSTVVIINGPIWITGKLIMSNGATMKPDDSLSDSGVSVLLGQAQMTSNGASTFSISTKLLPNSQNGYLGFFTLSSDNPQVIISTLTSSGGIAKAIFYGNGTSGISGYPPAGNIKIADNTEITVTSIVSNVLELGMNSTLTYETGLAGASFVGGSGATWQAKKGTYSAIKTPENKNATAQYDPSYSAPTCSTDGIVSCDSGTLLNGRDNVPGIIEANTPNTTDSCLDDTGVNQSRIDSIVVKSQNGSSELKVGTSVVINTKGFFESPDGAAEGVVDFYYKNAIPGYWTKIGSSYILDPNGDPGPFDLTSSAFNLTGSAGMQVVRAQYRDHNAGAASCSRMYDYPYTDEQDDLVFKVGS